MLKTTLYINFDYFILGIINLVKLNMFCIIKEHEIKLISYFFQ